MANPDLVAYVRQQLASGVTEDMVRTALSSQQWGAEDINAAVAVVGLERMKEVPGQAAPMPVTADVREGMWNKQIPYANKGTFWVSIFLIFGLNLVILVLTSFSLFMFWAEMLIVFAIFCLFYFLEEKVYRKKFASSTSKLDPWIFTIIGLRNFAVILNAIPLIQVIGALLLMWGFIPFLLVYIILMSMRRGHAGASPAPQSAA